MKNKLLTLKFAGTLIVGQFLALLCSLLILTIIGFFSKNGSGAFQSLLCLAVFVVIIYFDSWHKGSEDINKIKLGFIKKNIFKGMLAGLIAIIPSFLLALFAFFSESKNVIFFDFLGIDLFSAINRFWQLPLSFLFNLVNNKPVLNLLIPFFVPVISGVGYLFGLNRISIKQIMLYKGDEK